MGENPNQSGFYIAIECSKLFPQNFPEFNFGRKEFAGEQNQKHPAVYSQTARIVKDLEN